MSKDRDDEFKDLLQEGIEKKDAKAKKAIRDAVIEEQQYIIDGLTRSEVPALKPTKHLLEGNPVVQVVVGDIHGSAYDRQAMAAFLGDLEHLKPDRIVNMGDFIDCAGFLSEHHTLGHVAETNYSYPEDIMIGNDLLDKMQPHCKEMVYLFGNHEHRVEKYVIDEALKKRSDRQWMIDQLMRVLSVESLLNLDKRGIKYIKPGEMEDDTYIHASWKFGKSLYIHHGATGPNGAKKMISDYQMNVCYAHTHKGVYLPFREGGTGNTLLARNYGCMCRLQPLWNNRNPTGWTTGYGLEIFQPDGTFIAIPIPIINGVSMLQHLSKGLA